MSDPYLGEIRLMSFGFAPKGWARCDGQRLPIEQNSALHRLLGTRFGGDGTADFALPDLRDRTPIGSGGYHRQGEAGGQASHRLTVNELPGHEHPVRSSAAPASTRDPLRQVLGAAESLYVAPGGRLTALAPTSVTEIGGGEAHENRQPFLTVNFCISLTGVYPPGEYG